MNHKKNYSEFYRDKVIDKLVDECPICHRHIVTDEFKYKFSSNGKELFFILECPNINCNELFGVKYAETVVPNAKSRFVMIDIFPKEERVFICNNIKMISSTFEEIYTQSAKAKALGLNQICGIGYRKALEFLIKDYSIICNREKENEIKELKLGEVINNYIDNPNIRDMAKRAAWLGNDEAHYLRIWKDKDIKDLIKLINLTMQWVELEVETEGFKEKMSKPIKLYSNKKRGNNGKRRKTLSV